MTSRPVSTRSNSVFSSVQESEERIWAICDDEWFLRAWSDQWWKVTAGCPHGDWRATSHGAIGLTEAMDRLAYTIEQNHP